MAIFVSLAGVSMAAKPKTDDGTTFTIEKLQRIDGEGAFTSADLTAEVGDFVEYEIVVTNTSDSTISFSELEDENCSGVFPDSETELEAGDVETFTCAELLTEPGVWTNQASIEGNEEDLLSNTVSVAVTEEPEEPEETEEPEFRVEKQQRIKGSDNDFTTDFLTGRAGETVEYEIVVTNEGDSPVDLSPLVDEDCTNISPSGSTQLDVDSSESFTCEHALAKAGEFWTNTASISSGEITEESNTVYAMALEEPEFTIEKHQRIEGTETPYTSGELTAKPGQTIAYEIVVSNTGERPLRFEPLADKNCSGVAPAGETELEPGETETFTCQHVIEATGSWSNVAEIEGEFTSDSQPEGVRANVHAHARVLGEGVIKKASSNEVITNVPAEAAPQAPAESTPQPSTAVVQTPAIQQVQGKCSLSESQIVLHGASGSKHGPFTIHISSLGIKQITFYLDGHKLKTLAAAQARNGQFSVRIDAGKLHYGVHRVSVRTVMSDSLCAAIARAGVFVHARPAAVKPKFTG
ncbi:MAG TPA: hypothetical protein VMB91_00730 [Solirubrobacteraceae bacterium]|nr:hypothetical protein [Solirubrobacteraceae bacterium]